MIWNTSELAEEELIRRELFEELQHGEHCVAWLEPGEGPAEILVPGDCRTEEEFLGHFRGTPVRRLGLARWRRNALTVLGNVGNIIANTIQKLGDGTITQTKEGIESKIKKIKALLNY